jgi:hypothetical protein
MARPVTLPAKASANWRDWPLSVGAWTYAKDQTGSAATFAMKGGAGIFSVRCGLSSGRRIILTRSGVSTMADPAPIMMTVRSTAGLMQWPVRVEGEGALATLAVTDSGLDKMLFSRGRYAVEVAGASTLILPTWAEVAKVVEDCRV